MRDRNRIPSTIASLRAYWEARPELRVGQIIANAAQYKGHDDAFYIEDAELIETIAGPWMAFHQSHLIDGVDVTDPTRIPIILGALRAYWTANSDLRLGQIVENAVAHTGRRHGCFGLEDEELLDTLTVHTFNR